MREKFKGYYRLTEADFGILWKNAVFVFDTNVLLNLYRYQTSTRDELLKVLNSLKDRVWIPHHVGLEYQRNRLTVIAQQQNKFAEVKNIVSNSLSSMSGKLDSLQLKKRHSYIDPDILLNGIDDIQQKFLKELETQEKASTTISSEDLIRNQLDNLFSEKVGKPFKNQDELTKVFDEGEKRYEKCEPPGFKDSNKDSNAIDTFTYGGLTYKQKYGDLIVWKQIIDHAKEAKLKDVIFITDDSKTDWWLKIESGGTKTIGPRPELIDEIQRDANIERFYMYDTEGFLNYANKQLDAQVAKTAIEEVREVSFAWRPIGGSPSRMINFAKSAKHSVLEWLSKNFEYIESNQRGFPDFIVYKGDLKCGFEVRAIRNPMAILPRFMEIFHRAYYTLKEKEFDEITIILFFLNEELIDKTIDMLHRRVPEFEGNLKIIAGKGGYDEETETFYEFIPCVEI